MRHIILVPLFLSLLGFQTLCLGALLYKIADPGWGFLAFGGFAFMVITGGIACAAAWEDGIAKSP